MASSIVDFYNRNQREINLIVDKTYFELNLSESPLNEYFPEVDFLTPQLVLAQITRKPTVATVVANADIPASNPVAELEERIMRRIGFGKKYEFTDVDLEAMRQLEMYLMGQGNLAAAATEEMKSYFFGLAADLAPAIRKKHFILMMQLQTTGSISYTDPLSDLTVSLSYSDTEATLLPAALSGANNWNAPTTATGLLNLQLHAEEYYDFFGKFPDSIWLRRSNFRELRNQASTQSAFVAMSGINLDSSQVDNVYVKDDALVELIKERTKVQDVILMDTQYYELQKDASVTSGHYLPDDYYCFVDKDNALIGTVPTAEKDFQPGMYILVETERKAPRKDIMLGYQKGIPVIKDSRKIAARKVNS